MKVVTVKIPESYLKSLDELISIGRYASRSEAIRAAIRDLLKKELWEAPEPEKSAAEDEENRAAGDRGRGVERERIIRLTL